MFSLPISHICILGWSFDGGSAVISSQSGPETTMSMAPAAQNKILGGGQQKKEAVRLFGDITAGGGDHQPNSHPAPQSRKPRPRMSFATVRTPKGVTLRSGRNPAAKGAKFDGFMQSRASSLRSDDSSSENSSMTGYSESEACNISNQVRFCDSPVIVRSRVRQQASEFRSLIPWADLLPSMSSRRVLDGGLSYQNDGGTENSYYTSQNLSQSSTH